MKRNTFKKVFSSIQIILFTIILSVSAQSEFSDWGPEETNMTWYDAKKKCASKGMRLPTVREYIDKTEVDAKDWNNLGANWTSEEDSKTSAWVFNLRSHNKSSYPKGNAYGVHCHKL